MMVAIAVVLLANSVSAQDDPRVGITMGYPQAIGVIWHVNDRIALRPEVTIDRTVSQSTTVSSVSAIVNGRVVATSETEVSTTNSWQAGVGLSALFYLSKHDALRTYVSPRWTYVRSSYTSDGGLSDVSFGLDEAAHSLSGSFGAQYTLGRRFAVFGEAGLAYTHLTRSPNTPDALSFITSGKGAVNGVAVRSGAGVILYF
jgi:hypothetical protein